MVCTLVPRACTYGTQMAADKAAFEPERAADTKPVAPSFKELNAIGTATPVSVKVSAANLPEILCVRR